MNRGYDEVWRGIGSVRLLLLLVCFALGLFGEVGSARSDEPSAQPEPVVITYLANEGILVSSGEKAVVVDGLFRDGVEGYARVEPDTLEKLETNQAPFDQIEMILVTHYHADHFDAASVVRHLAHNPRAKLVTSEQVVERVRSAATEYDSISDRVVGVAPRFKTKTEVEMSGVTVEIFKLSHGAGRFAKIWNLGYIINIAGKRILHIGDAELNRSTQVPLKMHAMAIDVACVPHWLLTTAAGQSFVRDTLKPKHVIAIHVSPRKAVEIAASVRAAFPSATTFTRPGTTRTY